MTTLLTVDVQLRNFLGREFGTLKLQREVPLFVQILELVGVVIAGAGNLADMLKIYIV